MPYVTFAYNSAVQESTGYSPFFLLYGREPTTTLETILDYPEAEKENYDEYVQRKAEVASEARRIAVETMRKRGERMKEKFDLNHRDTTYTIGDLVAIHFPIRKVGRSEKLMRRYFGPYIIRGEVTPVTYSVQPLDNPRNRKPESIHVSRMKPYYMLPEDSGREETDEEEP